MLKTLVVMLLISFVLLGLSAFVHDISITAKVLILILALVLGIFCSNEKS